MIFSYELILENLLVIVNEWCEKMVFEVVEVFEVLMIEYLEIGDLMVDEIIEGLCIWIIVGEIQFMLCGSVFKNKGVQCMLDVVVELMFLLVDILLVSGIDEDGNEVSCKVDDNEKFLVLVFKLMIDFYVGQLIFVCVYFGVLSKGDSVYNLICGKKECIGCIVQMYVNNWIEVDEICVGDIVVCVGLKDVIIGEMLCDLDVVIILVWMEFFELVIL